jgi:hypothetical protein
LCPKPTNEPTSNQDTNEPTSNYHTTSEPSTPQADDDNILANPEPANEFVYVDEENLYLRNACKFGFSQPEFVSDSKSDSDYQEGYDEDDELVGRDPVPLVIVASYNKEDPPMVVGSKYSYIDDFKLALSYYAIKCEIVYETKKSDPGRMIFDRSRKVAD